MVTGSHIPDERNGIKIKRPQTGYVIKEIGNVDIKVIGVYTEKPSDHYLCIIVANKDRNRSYAVGLKNIGWVS